MSTSAPQFGIQLPGTTFTGGDSSTPGSVPSVVGGPINIPNYSDVHLGMQRRLTNISCQIVTAAAYTKFGAPATAGTPSHALITFNLKRNGNLVFSSSAQVELAPIIAGSGNTWITYTQYGIFSDFVNPVILNSGDNLSAELFMAGMEKFLVPPDVSPVTDYGNDLAVVALAQQGQVITALGVGQVGPVPTVNATLLYTDESIG